MHVRLLVQTLRSAIRVSHRTEVFRNQLTSSVGKQTSRSRLAVPPNEDQLLGPSHHRRAVDLAENGYSVVQLEILIHPPSPCHPSHIPILIIPLPRLDHPPETTRQTTLTLVTSPPLTTIYTKATMSMLNLISGVHPKIRYSVLRG